jgi:hypothetical protein
MISAQGIWKPRHYHFSILSLSLDQNLTTNIE